ncbi:MAG: glycoside hydrolase family 28 protein [Marinilabiliaceae bacterium]|nr:glycoside hydrolase family 28 protein [Marinilabiliaceae bacterium]
MCNKYIVLLSSIITFASCQTNPSSQLDTAFAEAEKVVESIVIPQFCNDTLNIVAFGAKTTSSALDNQRAIQAAIDSACNINGACVVIPSGEWLTAPIVMKSGVNLIVSKDATLKFSTDHKDYLPAVKTRWEGLDCYNLTPLIYADSVKNIAITGEGTIDGQGSNETWWYMKGLAKFGWNDGMISQLQGGRDSLLAYDKRQVDIKDRIMDIKDGLRPQLINICNSKNVLIEGVTLKNSPFWVIHPLLVTNLTVRGVKIESHGPNSDGCDPESCSNVLIDNCFFDTGDDCIAIKSGRNYDGRRWNTPSQNIIVRNCHMKNGHGGVVVGSEISGGFSNLWVENCIMDSPELERVVRIKTSNCRGGVIENIFVRNVEVGQCQEAILKINLNYEPNEPCIREFPPVVQNVNLENISSKKSEYGVRIIGLDESPENVKDVFINNCRFNGVEKGNSVTNSTNVKAVDLYINNQLAEL